MTAATTTITSLRGFAAEVTLRCAWCHAPIALKTADAGFGVCDACIPVALDEVLARLTETTADVDPKS